jgi:hypothetical protein
MLQGPQLTSTLLATGPVATLISCFSDTCLPESKSLHPLEREASICGIPSP